MPFTPWITAFGFDGPLWPYSLAALVLLGAATLGCAVSRGAEDLSKAVDPGADRFQLLLDNATDVIYIHDLEGRLLLFNAAAERLTGFSREEAFSDNILEFVRPDQREIVQRMIRRKIEGDESAAPYELDLLRKEGGFVTVEVSSWPVREGGRVVGVQGIARDVTARKREHKLREIFATLGRSLSAASTPPEAARIIADSAQELIGWDACSLDLIDPDDGRHRSLLAYDTVDGERRQVPPAYEGGELSPTTAWVIENGPRLILRDDAASISDPTLRPFGDASRRSLSLMFVPIRNGSRVVGVFSNQSYRPGAYRQSDLEALQTLADHCGGALERIRAQQKLRDREQRFRALIEKTSDGIVLLDLHARILYSSPAATTILGRSPQEHVGTSAFDPLHPDDRGRVERHFSDFAEEPLRSEKLRVRVRRPEGSWRWLDCSATNLLREASVGGIVVNFRDVTDEVRAEADLRASEERFRGIFEAAPSGVAIVRGKNFLFTNEKCRRMFGYDDASEFARITILDCVAPEDRSEIEGRLRRHERGEDLPKTYEVLATRRDGSVFPCRIDKSAIHLPDGEAAVSFVTDISTQKKLEEQMRQAQKMESIGRLAAGMAHDFNNILSVILAYASEIRNETELTKHQSDGLGEIVAAAERANRLTRHLLAFSRKQPMHRAPLDLNELADRTLRILSQIIGQRIQVEVDCDPDLPNVQADAGMLDQVLTNLTINARDAMPGGGRLRVSTRLTTIDRTTAASQPEAREGKFACLAFEDTGVGIQPELIPKIFDPFFTTKEVGQGTGLGLATVYGMIKQHRGWTEVESVVDCGTTFRIYLPLAPSEDAAAASGPRLPTVLAVEDDPAMRELARQILRNHGFNVITAESASLALPLWEAHQGAIDLVLTDVIMPEGIDGVELVQKLRESRPDLKAVCMSGYDAELLRETVPLPHDLPFLKKPFRPNELIAAIHDALARPA